MYSMSLVTLDNEDNLLRLWVSIYLLHDVRCLRHNKFVYCSMFFVLFPRVVRRCRSGETKHWALKQKKRNKKTNKKITFSFVSLNVYASVFIERTIVFKTVSERCLCHISFSSWIFNRHHSCRGSTCTKDHIFPPWELWLLLLCPKLFYLLFFFKGGILNYFHVKFFFTCLVVVVSSSYYIPKTSHNNLCCLFTCRRFVDSVTEPSELFQQNV